MTTYRIYRKSIHPGSNGADVACLAVLGSAVGGSPQAAIRAWYKTATPFDSDQVEDETLVAIPESNHHELKLAVERQTRLVLS